MVITAPRRAAAAAAAALTLLGAAPRPADSDLVGFMLASRAWFPKTMRASTSERSYRITLTTSRGDRLVGIEDGPRRYWLMVTRGGERTESYFVGPIIYQYFPGEGWLKVDTARMMRIAAARGFHPRKSALDEPEPVVRSLPDRHVNGILMGAVQFTSRVWFPQDRSDRRKLVTMTCFYTKEGGEYQSCSAGKLYTVTFDRYGDPANHFVVPKAALDAPPPPWMKE